MNLCIFMPTGKTFSFKNVTFVHNNESYLVFEYKAMSDGETKEASFIKSNIAGYSTYANS